MAKPWIYKLTIPAEKSVEFIEALTSIDPQLLSEENLEVLQEGGPDDE